MKEDLNIREIIDNIYMVGIKLPNNPLKEINIFIIKGEDRSMIVDTGFNRPETIEAFEEIFDRLGLTYESTDLFLTHLHSDHTGLASYFDKKGMDVYASKIDAEYLNKSIFKEDPVWQETVRHSFLQGLEEDDLDLEDHPGYKFRPSDHVDYKHVAEGDRFSLAGYNLEVIDLKGHTPGLVGLYDKDKKVLFCADHILKKITPNITYWGDEFGDSLGQYFANLDKAYELEVDHLFSSHRELIDDHRERIDEIRNHHAIRLDEARKALRKNGPSTVRSLTKQMHWDISAKSWDDFPKSQKWFAAGEAHAHLHHLYSIGEAQIEEKDGVLYFSLKD